MDRCKICKWEGVAKHHNVKEMMIPTREEFDYFECPNCSCMQLSNVPGNLAYYYSSDYYSYNIDADNIESDVNIKDDRAYLDVGCGAGKLLLKMARSGYTNLTGCDPFLEKDIEYDGGVVKIYSKTIHEMTGVYDFILFNDSFEHVTDPHEVFKSAHRLLSDDGIISISIPVYPNIATEMFGTNWYQWDAPRHIFLHSVKSMELLAANHGFVIDGIEWNSNNSAIIRSQLYSMDIPYMDCDKYVREYFSDADIALIDENISSFNDQGYGDHAIFYLRKIQR